MWNDGFTIKKVFAEQQQQQQQLLLLLLQLQRQTLFFVGIWTHAHRFKEFFHFEAIGFHTTREHKVSLKMKFISKDFIIKADEFTKSTQTPNHQIINTHEHRRQDARKMQWCGGC